MKNTKTLFFLLGCLFALNLQAQNFDLSVSFQWDDEVDVINIEGEPTQLWKFEGGESSLESVGLPVFNKVIKTPNYGELSVVVENLTYDDSKALELTERQAELVGRSLDVNITNFRSKHNFYNSYSFIPIVERNGRFYSVTAVDLQVEKRKMSLQGGDRGPTGVTSSVLKDGEIYKIGVATTGVYKLTYEYLKNTLNIDIDNVDPAKIQLFGNGGGALPQYVGAERIDDLEENAVWIEGAVDGSFDVGDYLIFYGEGPHVWEYSSAKMIFNRQTNIYADANYYFIKIGNEEGKRVVSSPEVAGSTYLSDEFDGRFHFEEDKENIYHEESGETGSGRGWFGHYFKVNRSQTYNNLFNIKGIVPSSSVKVNSRMAMRADANSRYSLSMNGIQVNSSSALSASFNTSSSYGSTYNYALIEEELSLSQSNVNVNVDVPWPAGASHSEGWLDYITINARQKLAFSAGQIDFRDISSKDHSVASFELDNASSNTWVWNVSEELTPLLQDANYSGGKLTFSYNTKDTINEFVAFDRTATLLTPISGKKIANQNIHGISGVDLVILYHPQFEEDAMTLAEHRHDYSDLSVALVNINELYNEYSSGRQDPTAIRDFARALKLKSDKFQYLLLYGDASFDYKNKYNLGNHFIPTYQHDSNKPLYAYPTDDYYGIFYHENPFNPFSGGLDIAIGRLLVNNSSESKNILNKIIKYDTNEASKDASRTKFLFLADDEDSSGHLDDAEGIANVIYDNHKEYNVEKLYIDAFEQEPTPAGPRSPLISKEIDKNIFKGTSVITYLGHGGPLGWAQERILEISQIKSWENIDHLPLFVTATCTFTGYDDATKKSAGEEVFLNKKGGAIALLTTTRPVFQSENRKLTRATINTIMEKTPSGRAKTFGEIVQSAKNATSDVVSENTRKFTLIGDPSQLLKQPFYDVKTTTINGVNPAISVDTLSALDQVTISGAVYDLDGEVLTSFNGFVYPTIYDKEQVFTTLGQDNSPLRDYKLQKRVIFKGKASVKNGLFSFTFVVPKDIDYAYGEGKISYYAASAVADVDAAGYTTNVVIGGANENGVKDDTPPIVEVFMNTEDFVSGGTTDDSPVLLVKLSDDYGINVVGNSIGHDLEGVLDENVQGAIILNDFYESEADNSTKGMVRYPLSDIEEGVHQIKVKAWDIANNLGEGYTEFIVAGSDEVALEHVLNYPNPFINRTCIQFDSNVSNSDVEVLVRIYTVSGRLVKTIHRSMYMDGSLRQDDCIEWDGTDDYGDQLARGTYIYKVHLQASNATGQTINGESKYEKMVILK